jgi:hypothetical protein
LVIIILIMMKTLQNIWKHKREFQINIFMINPQKGQNLKFDSESAIIKEKY